MSQVMLNFTVGPVTSPAHILAMGSEPVPYFRTNEFSSLMKENESMLKKLTFASEQARAVFLTGSGTFAMEAAVANVLTEKDRVIVVNGGSFGARFSQLCSLYNVPHTDISLEAGKTLRRDDLEPFSDGGYTALLVNVHETSTGVLYDLDMISDFCRQHGMLLIVDAISSFLADEFDMAAMGADVMITGSQKAFGVCPGMLILWASKKALARRESLGTIPEYYVDFEKWIPIRREPGRAQ